MKKQTGKAKGLIHQKQSFEQFELTRLQPSSDLACFVENYWIINWDLSGKPPYTQYNLPHPSQHLVIDPQAITGIFGVQKERFSYTLKDTGSILGVKFWPGAFHAFYKNPVNNITNKHIKISDVFGVNPEDLHQIFSPHKNPDEMVSSIETMLHENTPTLSEKAILAREVVEYIENNNALVTVSALTQKFGITTRTLQRLFDTYIGVSPKWVIDRYRMIDAVDTFNRDSPINLTSLAQELGYFDLAHFSKVFSKLVGFPPSNYSAERK